MPNLGFPSGTNTFLPSHAGSQSLVVGYSRSSNTFHVADWTQYINARNNQGFYYVWTSQEGARILTSDDAEHNWADGDAAPMGFNNLESGTWLGFATKRKAYPFTMGRMAVEQATFPILAAHAGVAAQQAMTARTMLAYTALSGASWGTNTAAVDGGILTSGQNWTTGSVGYSSNQGPNIKTSLNYASKVVHLATMGVVQPSQLSLVVNPVAAQKMSESTEIQDYIKQSPFAMAQLRGDVPNQNGKWGLPTMLYGHPVVIEDAVRITTRKNSGGTATATYILPNSEAYLVARDGELEGIEGARSYSTMQIFFYIDELTVESKYDDDNRRYLGRVVSNFSPVNVSVLSGFKFTSTGIS